MNKAPNRRFEDTVMYFCNEFGHEDEIEIEENKDKMKVSWQKKVDFKYSSNKLWAT